jgi:hypothetical protein
MTYRDSLIVIAAEARRHLLETARRYAARSEPLHEDLATAAIAFAEAKRSADEANDIYFAVQRRGDQ